MVTKLRRRSRAAGKQLFAIVSGVLLPFHLPGLVTEFVRDVRVGHAVRRLTVFRTSRVPVREGVMGYGKTLKKLSKGEVGRSKFNPEFGPHPLPKEEYRKQFRYMEDQRRLIYDQLSQLNWLTRKSERSSGFNVHNVLWV